MSVTMHDFNPRISPAKNIRIQRIISCSALLDGEYGEKDLCIGVPCILGKDGIEKIVEFDLNDEEKDLFHKSAEAVHKTNAALAGAL